MTVSGKISRAVLSKVRGLNLTLSCKALSIHIHMHVHQMGIVCEFNSEPLVFALACSLACMSSVLPATQAGWSVLRFAPPAAALWRGFIRTTSLTTWWRPTSSSTQV